MPRRTGTINVEHRWSYVDPFGRGETDSGMSIASVEEFLMGRGDDDVKQKLRAFMRERTTEVCGSEECDNWWTQPEGLALRARASISKDAG